MTSMESGWQVQLRQQVIEELNLVQVQTDQFVLQFENATLRGDRDFFWCLGINLLIAFSLNAKTTTISSHRCPVWVKILVGML